MNGAKENKENHRAYNNKKINKGHKNRIANLITNN